MVMAYKHRAAVGLSRVVFWNPEFYIGPGTLSFSSYSGIRNTAMIFFMSSQTARFRFGFLSK